MYMDGQAAGGGRFGNVAEALQAGSAVVDFLNFPAAAGLDGRACGEALTALSEIQGKLSAAYAGFLRRFDACDAHISDGYGSTSAWLAAKGQLTKKDARGGAGDAPARRAAATGRRRARRHDNQVMGAGGRGLDPQAPRADA